jgi:putative FmdB family regulatory protein
MPIYEYECKNGHRIELIQRIGENCLVKCPICKEMTQKIISAPEIPRNRGIWIFDRKTKRDILHDK